MDSTSYDRNLGASLLRIFDEIWARKGAFFSAFFVIALISYGILYAVDFIPEAPEEDVVPVVAPVVESTATTTAPLRDVARYPERIIIEKIDIDTDVLNPAGDSIVELDAALLKGAVRHPGSADFKNTGTIFIAGHSSYLPVVHNQNFKAFNGIQKLVWGDEIIVRSDDTEYVYRVEKVYKAAASETEVELNHSEPRLILVTCNSFGSKDDRFVVEASLMRTEAL